MNIELKKAMGIPNLYPYKEELMNALERKENIDKDMRDQLKALAQANA